MALKKPIDKYDKYSKEEEAKMLEEFRENFDEEDEKALISAALKTFTPAILGLVAVFAVIGFILSIWLN